MIRVRTLIAGERLRFPGIRLVGAADRLPLKAMMDSILQALPRHPKPCRACVGG
jgi:hypothetical protein